MAYGVKIAKRRRATSAASPSAPPHPCPQEDLGHAERPRLVVTRSTRTSSRRSSTTSPATRWCPPPPWRPDRALASGDKTRQGPKVGELVAERAKAAGIEAVVFDRAGNKYHGRVAALADGAREGGLEF